MDRKKIRNRTVELGKNVLILLLTCSALWLAARSQLFGSLGDIFREEERQPETVQTQGEAQADLARPLGITANLEGGTGTARYGLRYDAEAVDAIFQRTAGLLMEALSSAGEPVEVSRSQWELAQDTVPGVSYDFQGALPLEVLAGWLAGENTALTAHVRRLTLTVWGDGVALCYRDEENGRYYCSLSQVASAAQLAQALSGLGSNGAYYAFESEDYSSLDPDTLLLAQLDNPAVYSASNPVSGGQSALKELMEDLGVPVNSASFYSSGDEEVARRGDDMVRLSSRGVLTYLAEGDRASFPIQKGRSTSSLFETVEACRQLVAAVAQCGEARLYLMSVRDTEEGLEVRFGYHLNGILVHQEEGCAARFLVRDGAIVQFTLSLRSYAATGESTPVLPLPQATAALTAMGLEEEELLLAYMDTGAERVTAAWTAAVTHLTEGG